MSSNKFHYGNLTISGSLMAQSITGSLQGTASYALNASSSISSSYALTASYATNAGTTVDTGSFVTTSSFNNFTSSYSTGSFTGSFVGDGSGLTGVISSSYAESASYALSSSYSLSSSYALTSSYASTASYSQNLQISGSIANVDYIDFNTGSAEPAWKSGRVYWNNTDGALSVYNAEADISLQVGQENWVRAYNASGVLVTNGTAVRLVGSHGDAPEIQLAQSIQVSGSVTRDNQILGIATHDIEINSFGYITTQGLVKGLNTSAYLDGDRLYVSSSAGKLTKIPPTAPYEIIPAAVVVKAGPGGSGILYASPQQPIDFSDLSSVVIEGSYSYGDLWTYIQSGSVGVWKHTNQLSGSYGLTGSLSVISGSITSNLIGTASWADNSSTASYVKNAQSASYYVETDPIFVAKSGSFATTGSNIFSGSQTIQGNLSVIGTASFTYTTSSIINIGSSIITLNTDTPAARFGGITVIDSGSFGTDSTGSLLWDSQNNRWIYSNPSASTYDGGMLISGPRNTTGLGSEVGVTRNFLVVGNGADHISSSMIFHSASITQITGSLEVIDGITGSLLGTASTASYVQNAQTASYVVNAISASYIEIAQTASYVVNAISASYINLAQTASYYAETDPIFVAKSGSLATTGSNTFVGTQTIQGLTRITGTSTNELVRITQTGTGAALIVEDETNPDTSPFVIDASGSVGIGTTTPTWKLVVSKNNGVGLEIDPDNGTPGKVGVYAFNRTTSALNPLLFQASQYQFTNGNVGIGITSLPSASLHINNTTTSASFLVEDETNPDTSPFIIDNVGNVGIGTTTPSYQLDITSLSNDNGTLRILGSGSFKRGIIYLETNDIISGSGHENGRISFLGSGSSEYGTIISQLKNTTPGSEEGEIIFRVRKPSQTITNSEIFRVTSTGISIGKTDSNASLDVSGSAIITGSLTVTAGITGSLLGTASWAQNATSASFLTSNTNAFIQGGNSFGTTALLGTNDTQNLQFETNGLVRMAVSSSGNVGIGTSTPSRLLSVNGVFGVQFNDATESLAVNPTSTGVDFIIKNGSNPSLGEFRVDARTGQRFAYYNGGNFAIGTSADDGINKLQVVGSAIITGSTATDLVRITQTGTGNAFVVEDSTNPDTSPFVIDNSGDVGIGISSPSRILHTSGSTNRLSVPLFEGMAISETRFLTIKRTDGSAEAFINYTGNDLAFGANGVERLRIGRNGDIAIGTATSAPGARLYLTGNDDGNTIRTTPLLIASASANTDLVRFTQTGTGNSFVVEDTNTPDSSQFVINNVGDVGVGTTTPNSKLEVNGNTNITGSLTVSDGGVKGITLNMDTSAGNSQRSARLLFSQQDSTKSTAIYATSGSMVFATSASYNSTSGLTRMFISESGDIGIGKSNPTAKLDINGNTIITGSLTVTGSINSYDNITLLQNATYLQGKNSSNVTTRMIGINSSNILYIGSVDAAIGSIFFNINGSNLLQISSSGDVGLGKSNPTSKLDISGSALITGSLTVTAGITGSLLGTASTASYVTLAQTASYVVNAISASYIEIAQTASYFSGSISNATNAVSASYALTASYVNPLIQDVVVTGSLTVSGSLTRVIGTLTADGVQFIRQYNTSVNVLGGSLSVGKTGSANETLDVNGNTIITGSLNVTAGITGSLLGTATTASYVNPLIQDVTITGSLIVTAGITGSLLGTATTASYALTASYAETTPIPYGIINAMVIGNIFI